MKKIFTLALGILFTGMLFAADRRPTVTLNNSRNYEIVIDGKSFYSSTNAMSISNMYGGRHTIKVFELRKGLFVKGRKLLDSQVFQVTQNDMIINIGRTGSISIVESRKNNRFDKNDRDWNNRDDRGAQQQKGRNGRF